MCVEVLIFNILSVSRNDRKEKPTPSQNKRDEGFALYWEISASGIRVRKRYLKEQGLSFPLKKGGLKSRASKQVQRKKTHSPSTDQG
jgi:hypothetical protein